LALQYKYNSLQNEFSELQGQLKAAQAELKLYQDTGIKVYSNTQPDVVINTLGDLASLTYNSNAHNPMWAELVSFIAQDDTDSYSYGVPNLCGWFAERVYNDAERAGIRAAFVVVNFEEGIGHALNAFNTTDMGLVYIDCTGESRMGYPNPLFNLYYIEIGTTASHDKVAYIKIGKPVGMITLGCPYGLSYADYEQWKKDVQSMKDRFEKATSNSEMYQLKEESDQKLGSFWEEDPTEIVKSIEIYW